MAIAGSGALLLRPNYLTLGRGTAAAGIPMPSLVARPSALRFGAPHGLL